MKMGLQEFRFGLGTAPSHVSIPPNQNGTMAKDGLMTRENVLGAEAVEYIDCISAKWYSIHDWSPNLPKPTAGTVLRRNTLNALG